jgi:DNA polymerase-3 subunit alpha
LGRFESLEDFISKVDPSQINRKVWESLIKAGAFDKWGDRGALLESIDSILGAVAKLNKDRSSGQTDLFGNSSEASIKLKIELPSDASNYSQHEYLQWERELLGIFLSKHPLEPYGELLSEQTVPIIKVTPENDTKSAVVGGLINAQRQITTKNGKQMSFVRLEDINGDECELVVFPSVFKEYNTILQPDKVVIVNGRINASDKNGYLLSEAKLVVNSVREISEQDADKYKPIGRKKSLGQAPKQAQPTIEKLEWDEPGDRPKRLYIRVADTSNIELLENLKSQLDTYKGQDETVLVLGVDKQIIKLPQKITYDEELITGLKQLLGQDCVVYQ